MESWLQHVFLLLHQHSILIYPHLWMQCPVIMCCGQTNQEKVTGPASQWHLGRPIDVALSTLQPSLTCRDRAVNVWGIKRHILSHVLLHYQMSSPGDIVYWLELVTISPGSAGVHWPESHRLVLALIGQSEQSWPLIGHWSWEHRLLSPARAAAQIYGSLQVAGIRQWPELQPQSPPGH